MDLHDIVRILSYFIKGSGHNISLSPDEFNRVLDLASIRLFRDKLGIGEVDSQLDLEEYYGVDHYNDNSLRRFKVDYKNVNGTGLPVTDGYADLPDDYFFPDTLFYRYVKDGVAKKKRVRILTSQRWNHLMSRDLLRPTLKDPACRLVGDRIEFYPTNMSFIDFTYLRRPAAPVYGVDYTGGYPKYSSGGSTQLEWGDEDIVSIIFMVLRDLGVSAQKQDVAVYADKLKTQDR